MTPTRYITVAFRLGFDSRIAVDKMSLSKSGRKPIFECHASSASSPAFLKCGYGLKKGGKKK